MTKLLPLAAAVLLPFAITAQTTMFSEDFNGSTYGFTLNTTDVTSTASGSNTWLVNNNYSGGTGTFMCLSFPFTFTVANVAQQPSGIAGFPTSNYMHITSQAAISAGINCGCFIAADGICNMAESYFSTMTSDISTVGYSNTTISFWWLCGGSASNYGEVYYSTDGGTTWTSVSGQYLNSSSAWQQQSVYDSNFDNQATLRFGFRFNNQTTTAASDPGFCIDDVLITAQLGMGLATHSLGMNLSVMPNPANDVLTLKSNITAASDQMFITITDITGAVVRRETYTYASMIEISTTKLSAGSYLLTAEMGESTSTVRFSVTH